VEREHVTDLGFLTKKGVTVMVDEEEKAFMAELKNKKGKKNTI